MDDRVYYWTSNPQTTTDNVRDVADFDVIYKFWICGGNVDDDYREEVEGERGHFERLVERVWICWGNEKNESENQKNGTENEKRIGIIAQMMSISSSRPLLSAIRGPRCVQRNGHQMSNEKGKKLKK